MTCPSGSITIGGYSESHLLNLAKTLLERKSSETPIFDLEAENHIPKFDSDELLIGKLLGEGGFCKVCEVTKVALKEGVAQQIGALGGQKDGQQVVTVLQDRTFMQAYYLRSGTDYRYAIKKLRDDAVKDEQTFINGIVDLAIEARFLAVIRHQHIIKMRAFSSGTPFSRDFFLVLDRLYDILSRTLVTWKKRQVLGIRKVFDRQGKKTSTFWVERIKVAHELAGALHHLHSLSIVYRDLKPDNIGFDIRGDVKIFDFGLARQLPAEKLDDGVYNMTGDTGSPPYIAPEVSLGHPYNLTADVYSFGILLHQICSLEMPFEGFTVKMFDKMVIRGGSRPKCDPKWPPRVHSLIQNCWSANISNRPSMQTVMETLREDLYEHTGKVMKEDGNDVSAKTQHSIRKYKAQNGSSRSTVAGTS